MSEEREKAFGGCHCGAVRYEVIGKPDYVACCHCESCRKTTGAPMVVYSTYLKEQVRFTKGERKIYESSPGVGRTFCSNCGTPLTYEAEWGGQTVIGFFISTLDRPEEFPPERHVFDADRISWFDVADQLPRYRGVPAGKEPDRFGPAVDIGSSPSNK